MNNVVNTEITEERLSKFFEYYQKKAGITPETQQKKAVFYALKHKFSLTLNVQGIKNFVYSKLNFNWDTLLSLLLWLVFILDFISFNGIAFLKN